MSPRCTRCGYTPSAVELASNECPRCLDVVLEKLERREGGPLTSDPDNTVLIEMWLEAGADLQIWTDAEAEAHRLKKFGCRKHRLPRWELHNSSKSAVIGSYRGGGGGTRDWHWNAAEHPSVSIERFFSIFDTTPDYALAAPVSLSVEAEMNEGCQLDPDFFTDSTRDEALPWPQLVALARSRIAAAKAARAKHRARKKRSTAATASP